MKSTKTIEWTSPNGAKVEVIITVEKEVTDEISYSDGWNINLGPKTYESLNIIFKADGKTVETSRFAPHITTSKPGAYAVIGSRVGIQSDKYELIMAAIAELKTEVETIEYAEIKAIEIAKEAKKEAIEIAKQEAHKEELKNGLCPHCGTYCYGDCRAN